MYEIKPSNRFKRDLRLAKKRAYDLRPIEAVTEDLPLAKILDEKYRDHVLSGNYQGLRECHITPDWLLIYKIEDNELILYLSRTGTHSDLF